MGPLVTLEKHLETRIVLFIFVAEDCQVIYKISVCHYYLSRVTRHLFVADYCILVSGLYKVVDLVPEFVLEDYCEKLEAFDLVVRRLFGNALRFNSLYVVLEIALKLLKSFVFGKLDCGAMLVGSVRSQLYGWYCSGLFLELLNPLLGLSVLDLV